MAGAGFKTFNTGDVLTAAQVNTYLMQQTVMVFDNSTARTTALGANVSEGMLSYLKDTNQVEVYDGSSWVASDDPNAIQNSIVDAKGDIITATADNTPSRLAVGTNGQVLTADSTTATGLKWASSGGGMTELATSTPSGVSSVSFSSISSSHKHLLITYSDVYGTVDGETLILRFNADSGTNYSYYVITANGTTTGAGNSQGTTEIRMSTVITSATGLENRTNGFFWIYNYAQTGYSRQVSGGAEGYLNSGSARIRVLDAHWKNTASAINQIDLSLGSGNFSAGKITLYGVS